MRRLRVTIERRQVDAGGDDCEPGIVGDVDGTPVPGMGVLLASFQPGGDHVHSRVVHRQSLGFEPGAEVKLAVEGVGRVRLRQLVELLGSQRVGGEGERHRSARLEQNGADAAVAVVGGEGIWQVVAVEANDVGDPIAN